MEEANKGALKIGAIIGVVAGLLSLGLGFVAFIPCIGCCAGFANWAVPAAAGLLAGGAAAFTADWSDVEPDDKTMFGVGLGVRAGAVAALCAAVAYAVVAFISPLVGMVFNVLIYGSGSMEDLIGVVAASLITMIIGLIVNLGIAVFSTLVGLALGAVGGAIASAIKE